MVFYFYIYLYCYGLMLAQVGTKTVRNLITYS